MARFDNAIALATRLIDKSGQLVQWQSTPDPTPIDASQPWLGGDTVVVNRDVKICFIPIEDRRDRNFFDFMPDNNIQVGSLAGMMAPVSFEPSAKDTVMRDGKQLRIKNINLYQPNEQKVLWVIEFYQ